MAEPRAGPERVRARRGSPEKGGGGPGLQPSPASAAVLALAAVRCGRGGPALAEGAGPGLRAGAARSPRWQGKRVAGAALPEPHLSLCFPEQTPGRGCISSSESS